MTDTQQHNSDALLKLQDDFNEILTGIYIDESTFRIDLEERKRKTKAREQTGENSEEKEGDSEKEDDNREEKGGEGERKVKESKRMRENSEGKNEESDENDKGSVALLKDVIEELNQLSEDVYEVESLRNITRKIKFLTAVSRDIVDGSYFSSIDDVWWSSQESFESYNETLFDRTSNSPIFDVYEQYKNTVEGAVDTDNIEATSKASSAVSSSVQTPRDIFGVVTDGAESAHLMPNSPTCSPLWYHFVSWVLCRLTSSGDNNNTDAELVLWNYFQKCIRGFIKISHSRRADGVGIKHFPSNRIGLKDQKLYLDNYHCLLIIPIMSVDQVKNWSGTAYSAIVLAGNFKNGTPASRVYRNINADQGTIDFADENECNVARTLLETMVLCVCKSSRDTFTEEFHNSETMKTFYKGTSAEKPVYIKKEEKMAPVPKSWQWNNKYRVRKITFSQWNDVDNNPAPDPVLLLGKAASNWLKRHDLFVLPGCDTDDDSSSCNGSNFVASYRDEMAIRGWTTEMFTRSHIDDVVEVSCFPGDDTDEPLSDDDE
jgi:hypothetical protein